MRHQWSIRGQYKGTERDGYCYRCGCRRQTLLYGRIVYKMPNGKTYTEAHLCPGAPRQDVKGNFGVIISIAKKLTYECIECASAGIRHDIVLRDGPKDSVGWPTTIQVCTGCGKYNGPIKV